MRVQISEVSMKRNLSTDIMQLKTKFFVLIGKEERKQNILKNLI